MPSHFCLEVDIDVTNEVGPPYYSIISVSGDHVNSCLARSIYIYRRISQGFEICIQCNAGGSDCLRSEDGGTKSEQKRKYNVVVCYNHGGAQPRGKFYVDGVLTHTGDLTLNVASSGFVSMLSGNHNVVGGSDSPSDGSVIVNSLKVHDMDNTRWEPTAGNYPWPTRAWSFLPFERCICSTVHGRGKSDTLSGGLRFQKIRVGKKKPKTGKK